MWHRPLAEMLNDVYDAVQTSRSEVPGVRATRVELTLPVEVRLEQAGGELAFIADVPVWRWRTVFDQTPGQLRIHWEEVPL
jgi:hypothetical protein